jgi:transaldolase / glucose-6-phosphate isomerase
MGRRIDPRHTVFVVSSKSGTTTEPLSFFRYFWNILRDLGAPPGRHFIAITDPGTPLELLAKERHFRETFTAVPTVGGRYSALTHFGLVPAALAGVDVRTILDRARAMAENSGPTVPVAQNSALDLAAVLGELATQGRDKLTFYSTASFAPFPDWLEQLVAESTGKIGRGIVPIVDEPRLPPENYGSDRLFVSIEGGGPLDAPLTDHLARLERAGQPIVRLRVPELTDLGQEFFRWELAVAASGMILAIDPFDQPDVELAKNLARQAMAGPAGSGGTPSAPTVPAADPTNLRRAVHDWRGSIRPGDYVGLQAYLAPTPETRGALTALRRKIIEQHHTATTLGFGPRFLHSTGQLHKGGPPSGVFLQIVDAPKHDLEVPGTDYTFGQLIRAQALGDYQALRQKGRRVLRVDLGTDVPGGLARLAEAFDG